MSIKKNPSINKDRALVFKSAFGTHHNLSGDLSSLLSFDNFYLKSNISFFFFFFFKHAGKLILLLR